MEIHAPGQLTPLQDASRVLSDAASGAGGAGGFDEPKLRVKALYRRGLAREALKKWQEAGGPSHGPEGSFKFGMDHCFRPNVAFSLRKLPPSVVRSQPGPLAFLWVGLAR